MLDASLEVRSAVVYASLIVVLVFLPVFFLDGLAGAFFRPLALAYVLAILASLLVALTVTPALSLHAAARPRPTDRPEAPLARWLQAAVPPRAAAARRAGRTLVAGVVLVARSSLTGAAAAAARAGVPARTSRRPTS